MKAVKSKKTKVEVKLAKELWIIRYMFCENAKFVFWQARLELKKHKLAVFIHTDYFYGKNWETEKQGIRDNHRILVTEN